MENTELQEASLSRVWKHFNSDKTVVILTAFRDENSKDENITKNKKIAAEFKNAGFGYFFVDGYWVENKGTNDEVKVSEDSIFVISDKKDSKTLVSLAHKLANETNQDAIFVKTEEETYLLDKKGDKQVLTGGLKPGKLGDFYTKLRNNKKTNTFVFEKERDGLGYFGSFGKFLKNK